MIHKSSFGSSKFGVKEVHNTWLMLTILSAELFILGWNALNQRLLILKREYYFLVFQVYYTIDGLF